MLPSSLLTYTNHTLLLDAIAQALILHLSFFKCFALFRSILPTHKSNMTNSFWITIIKIVIIKINIINGYTMKVYIFAKSLAKSESKSPKTI